MTIKDYGIILANTTLSQSWVMFGCMPISIVLSYETCLAIRKSKVWQLREKGLQNDLICQKSVLQIMATSDILR